ncbi:hypothetical protein AVEN_182364-1 [Araneus ventricosus]|uniref:Uncharacterized protein n=1 Tax=Araneus ventricosus TaxID=182803 RepID=A0A4Y2W6M3_ARAVE|nr:hypothetical protein AVEN_182364-1 [Araneus ventricosus]
MKNLGFQDKSFIEASLNIMQFPINGFQILSETHRNTTPKVYHRAADIPPLPFSSENPLPLSLAVTVRPPKFYQAPLGSMPKKYYPLSALRCHKRSAR